MKAHIQPVIFSTRNRRRSRIRWDRLSLLLFLLLFWSAFIYLTIL